MLYEDRRGNLLWARDIKELSQEEIEEEDIHLFIG
jgi:hypothetical protein